MHLCLEHMSFNDLGLSPELLKALKPKTYPSPTQVQRELVPAALKGQDAWNLYYEQSLNKHIGKRKKLNL